ncbi:MAG TPA: FAD-dependent oxidoreductase [Candidatus Paceibacterota bacterium]|jgi:hypothetical protein|nr:FAD-dependent oxidoreductase [Candidatus Paceibacterota bacterium]
MTKERLAIIGGGISGMAAAYFLHKKYDIVLFEKNSYIGGHAQMIDINYGDTRFAVDTAVMIFDRKNYENFDKLLRAIGLPESHKLPTNLSFSGSFEDGRLEYSSAKPLLQWNNTLSLRSWRLVWHYERFVWIGKRDLEHRREWLRSHTFAEYLAARRINEDCIKNIITPLYACIFSLTRAEVLEWPAETLMGFLARHNMLGADLRFGAFSSWRMLRGGTREYIERLTAPYKDAIRLNTPVKSIHRVDGKIVVSLMEGTSETFDKAIIAAHANEALELLAEPTEDERRILGSFPYTKKRTFIIHKDASVMPLRSKCWAAFNNTDRLPRTDGDMAITYWLNPIQGIDERYPIFLSINTEAVRQEDRLGEFEYTHPAFTANSYEAQEELPKLQGVGGIYYCGSYFGYACHEDGLVAAMTVSESLGGEIPWRAN